MPGRLKLNTSTSAQQMLGAILQEELREILACTSLLRKKKKKSGSSLAPRYIWLAAQCCQHKTFQG